jgi:transposase
MSRGGLGTKIHVRVDALGNPVQIELSAGQRHDYAFATTLTKDVYDANLIADLGYEGDALLQQLRDQRCVAVIPPRHHRKTPWVVDAHLYKERHLVECFFQKLKRNRRVAMRFEKLTTNFLAMVLLAAIVIWLA